MLLVLKKRLYNRVFYLLFFLMPFVFIQAADEMSIVVRGKIYEKEIFQNGSRLFTNRNYVVENLASGSGFGGFEFLASAGGRDIIDDGVIIPLSDGIIYILAKSTATIPGWTKIENSICTYDNGKSTMALFQKSVNANDEIEIPQTDDFQGATPLAKNITYINPDLISETGITVYDKDNSFSVRDFWNGSMLFTANPIYRLSNIPDDFSGFQFLASTGNEDNSGVIVAQDYGKIYVIARKDALRNEWSPVENTSFYSDYTCDEMLIYERFVSKGDSVPIPKTYDLEGASPLAKHITHISNPALPTVMSVEIKAEENRFEIRNFQNGAILFRNRTYYIDDVPSMFDGFEFLASNGGEQDEKDVLMIPSEDGYVYIAARRNIALPNDWIVIPNTEFYYNDNANSKLSIYRKEVQAGDTITMPDVGTDFRGIIPIAKRLFYGTTVDIKGELLDISTVSVGSLIFPQNNYAFGSDVPDYLLDKKYAVSLIENDGVLQFKSEQADEIYIAIHYNTLNSDDWEYTGDSFSVGSNRRYYIYKCLYNPILEWVDIPKPQSENRMSSIIFGNNIHWVNHQPLPESVVIARSLNPKSVFITNPSITIMPDGDYIASCTGAYRVSGKSGVSVFLSSDRGLTWQTQTKNNVVINYGNLFVHGGDLYLMGTSGINGDVIIRKSEDKGITWTEPTDSQTGVLIEGEFHSAPVPVVVHDGRIWRAMETNPKESGLKEAFVMSASVTSDLLKASNWTSTNRLAYDTNWISGQGKSFKQCLEGNVVVDPSGNIVNVLRVDEQEYGGVAAIAKVSSLQEISFNPATGIIDFPGGGKKFTIRYDAKTGKYWTLSNAVFDEDRDKSHLGIYASGIHCGLLRNRLVLMNSEDLTTWEIQDTLINYDNPFFYGFQYIDWQFDGDDIVAVSRTAFEDERGLPIRQHDANYFLFHRFENYNKGHDTSVTSISKSEVLDINYYNRNIYIRLTGSEPFAVMVYDLLGKLVTKKKNVNVVNVAAWAAGVYVVQVNQNGKLYSKKIIIS